jgi:RimJ/RimL family protein N-acetyltransferase
MKKPDPNVHLQGRYVRLEPLDAQHLAPLVTIVQANPSAFALTYVPRAASLDDPYFAQALRDRHDGTAVPFVMLRQQDGQVIGTTRYNRIAADEARLELGFTFIDPAEHGGPANVDAKFVMLEHAFEVCGAARLAVQADVRNARSLAAIEALGMTREGTLRHYGRAADGDLRDSAVFSMLQNEWPLAKPRLLARLEAKLSEHL